MGATHTRIRYNEEQSYNVSRINDLWARSTQGHRYSGGEGSHYSDNHINSLWAWRAQNDIIVRLHITMIVI